VVLLPAEEVHAGSHAAPRLPRPARASRGALPTQRRARLRVIVFSNPSHISDTEARAAMDGGALLDVYEGCTSLGMSTSSKAPPCTPSGMTIVNSSLPTVMVMASPGWRPAGTSTMMVDDGALCRLVKLSLDTARTRSMPSVCARPRRRHLEARRPHRTAEAAIHTHFAARLFFYGARFHERHTTGYPLPAWGGSRPWTVMVGNCTFAKYFYAVAITGPEDAG
jgi:hypothetical protein